MNKEQQQRKENSNKCSCCFAKYGLVAELPVKKQSKELNMAALKWQGFKATLTIKESIPLLLPLKQRIL